MAEVKLDIRAEAQKALDAVQSVLKGLDELPKKASAASGKFDSFFKDFEKGAERAVASFAKWTAGIGALVSGGGLALLTKQAIEFQSSMANVATIAGQSSEAMRKLSGDVLELSKTVPKGAKDIADGLYDAVSSGIEAGKAMEFMRVATMAATAGLSTTKDAVNAGTIAINTYGDKAGDVTAIYDAFFQTVNRGVITFPQLAQSLGNVSTIANQSGVAFKDLMASIALVTKNGIQASEATSAMRALIQSIAAPTGDARKMFEALHIEYGKGVIESKGLAGVIEQINQKTGGNAEALRKLIPEVNALTAAQILGKDAGRAYRDEIEAQEQASGATAKAQEIQSKTVASAWTRLTNTVVAQFTQAWAGSEEKFAKTLDTITSGFAKISAQDFSKIIGALERILSVVGGIAVRAAQAAAAIAHLSDPNDASGDASRSGVVVDPKTGKTIRIGAGRGVVGGRGGQAENASALLRMDAAGDDQTILGEAGTDQTTAGESAAAQRARAIAHATGRGAGRGATGDKADLARLEAQDKMERDAVAAERRQRADVARQAQRDVDALSADTKRRGDAEGRDERARRMAAYQRAMDAQALENGPMEEARSRDEALAGALGGAFAQGGIGGLVQAGTGMVSGGLVASGAQDIAGGSMLAGGAKMLGAGALNFGMSKLMELIALAGSLSPEKFGEAINALFEGAHVLIDNLVANLPTLFAKLETMIGPLIRHLGDAMPLVVRELAKDLGPLAVDVASAVIDAFVANIDKVIGSLIEGLTEGLGRMFEKLLDMLNPFELGKAPEGPSEEGIRTGTYRPRTGSGILGFATGGVVPDVSPDVAQSFAMGGVVRRQAMRSIQASHGADAVPVIAHAGEPVFTKAAWKEMEGVVVDAVKRGAGGAGRVEIVMRDRGRRGGAAELVGKLVTFEQRRQGGSARSVREMASRAPLNRPVASPSVTGG